jgi:phage baseplate assembly protein W
MSKSLKLVNGDLYISNRSLHTVRGKEKLLQDLSLRLREKIGTDPMTPTYGSILDGGVINGSEVPSFIGRVINPSVKEEIHAEIAEQISKYQREQLEKIKSETVRYQGKNTLDKSEVIYSIDSINISNIGTTIVAQVTLTTLANEQVNLFLPIDGA